MKTTRIALLALVFAGAGVFAGTDTRPAAASIAAGIHIGPSGHARVDLGFFYDDLAPYGSWVERPSYGWVWSPRITRANWRPYQYGHWAWTDYGWTWISDEPFGWATYHYGRWYDDPNYGWEWVPGEEWAPSYVSWQEGGDYIGWAPLPPSVSIRTGFLNVSLAPANYLFVPEGRFLDARVYDYAVPRRDCERIYRQTRNFTNYRYEGNRVFAAGVPVDRVQRVIGRNVPRYQVADQGWNQRHQTRFSGNRVAMFRPQVQRGRVAPPTARPLARNSVVSSNQLRQNRQGRQFQQNVAGQGRLNRQQQQAQIGRERQLQNQGRLNRQQQQIARRQLQDQGRVNRQQERQQQIQRDRQVRQNVAQNQGRRQQQVQRQERQVQNQERVNRQQQARVERQAQNQARNQGRRQQQVQRQERQAQNQERFNRQQQPRIERQAQNQARNQGRWQQQAQRQERQMARQQNAAPRWQGQGRQQQPRQQARQQNRRGGQPPPGNDRGNRHGRNGNG